MLIYGGDKQTWITTLLAKLYIFDSGYIGRIGFMSSQIFRGYVDGQGYKSGNM